MATYNGEKYLEEQLSSLLNQTRLPDEVVVCDDGSSDLTIEILKKFKEKAPFKCKLVQNECNKGTGKSFELAIELCTNEIIAFCDQDDIWNSTKLEKIQILFSNNPSIDFLLMNATVIDKHGVDLGYTLWEQRGFNINFQNLFSEYNQFKLIINLGITTGMSTAVRKKIIKKVGLRPAALNHDVWYIPFASLMGCKGLLVDDQLVQYRQHSLQQFGSRKQGFLKRFFSRLEKNYGVLEKNTKNYEALLEATFLHKENVLCHEKIMFLESKVAHFNARKTICNSRFSTALRACFSEIFNGRYAKCGTLKSIPIDFITRFKGHVDAKN